MPKYRKKPVVIEAFKWTADIHQSDDPEWIVDAIKSGDVLFINEGTPDVKLAIKTLEGTMTADRGDYIIKGIKDEIYPCKPDVFDQTYELVNEDA